MTQICKWLFAQPAAAAILPPAAAAAAPQAAAAAAAAPAAASDASMRSAPVGAPPPLQQAGHPPPQQQAGVPPPLQQAVHPPPPAPFAMDAMDALGLLPDAGADAFMDLLSDRELDMLIADLAGNRNNDAGHLLAPSSPRLP